jgi:hypothetical protein
MVMQILKEAFGSINIGNLETKNPLVYNGLKILLEI